MVLVAQLEHQYRVVRVLLSCFQVLLKLPVLLSIPPLQLCLGILLFPEFAEKSVLD